MERRLRRRKFMDADTQQLLLLDGEESPVTLERVLGLTVTSNAGLASNAANANVAYAAGCTVVLYDASRQQQRFLVSREKRPITCLAFSRDGAVLATGESGSAPAVRLWDLAASPTPPAAELLDHSAGVAAIAFSHDRRHLVSVGDAQDMTIVLWDCRAKRKMASARLSYQVHAMSFSESGSFVVTAGQKHVKFWSLKPDEADARSRGPMRTSILKGRSAILNSFRNNLFCGVVCGSGMSRDGRVNLSDRCFSIIKEGMLCEIDAAKRTINRWFDFNENRTTNTTKANTICTSSGLLYVGCDKGSVYIFDAGTLGFVSCVPLPHYLGLDVARATGLGGLGEHPTGVAYPDAIAAVVSVVAQRRILTVVYSDHSYYAWDVQDPERIGKVVSHLYHAGLVFGVDAFPAHRNSLLPPGTFATCSSDKTIRLWNLDQKTKLSAAGGRIGRSMYSSELVKILYTQPDDTGALNDADLGSGASANAGVRSLKFSPDGAHLASGDRSGNVRVHEMETCDVLFEREAHDSDVMSLDFSDPQRVGGDTPYLMVSGSRDSLMHLFDVNNNYAHLQTVDDHSSPITSARFVQSSPLRLVSGGSDKSVIFRDVVGGAGSAVELRRSATVAAQAALFDLQLEPEQKLLYSACYDHQIRTFDVLAEKRKTALKGSLGEAQIVQIELDPSGSYLASSSDKIVSLLSLQNGECLAALMGHSEVVSGMSFLPDARRLVTVSGDSCVFVWRLAPELSRRIVERTRRLAAKGVWGALPPPVRLPDEEDLRSEDDGTACDEAGSESSSLPSPSVRPSDPASAIVSVAANVPNRPNQELLEVPTRAPATSDTEADVPRSPRTGRRLWKAVTVGQLPSPRHSIPAPLSPSLDSGRSSLAPENALDERHTLIASAPTPPKPTFNVKERAELLAREHLNSSNSSYSRSNTQLSDDDDLSLAAGASFGNLRELAKSRDALHPMRHAEAKSAFAALAAETPPPPAFERDGPGRESISRRFLATSTPVASPTPPPKPAGRKKWGPNPAASSDNLHQLSGVSRSPSGSALGGVFLGKAAAALKAGGSGKSKPWQSEMDLSGRNAAAGPSWSHPARAQPKTSPARATNGLANPLFAETADSDIVMRAKAIRERLRAAKGRRLTMSSVPAAFLPVAVEEEPVDEYSKSELYQRTRSPARRATMGPAQHDYARQRHDSMESDFSLASSALAPGGRRRPPSSLGLSGVQASRSLGAGLNRLLLSPDADSPVSSRMNDIRQRLRKSQENLALAPPEAASVLASPSALDGLNRSKSYGSLAGAGLLPASPLSATPPASATLQRSRDLTKSTGNLHGARSRAASGSGRSLAETLRELKRASQTDLRGIGRDDSSTVNEQAEDEFGSQPSLNFYSPATTLPRRHRSSLGTVARKADAARAFPASILGARHSERASVSGDSDSASEHPASRRLSANHTYNRRYAGRKTSNLTPEAGDLQAKLQAERNQSIANWANGTGNGVGRQRNYLAAKLAVSEQGGPEVAADDRGGSETGSVENSYKEKMSRHCQDCLTELRTTLDKAVQAYQMVTARDDPQLAPEERDQLQKDLVRGFVDIQGRLNSVIELGERSEVEDGGSSEAPSARRPAPAAPGGVGNGSAGLDSSVTAMTLQHYSDVLVNMVCKQLNQKGPPPPAD